VDNGPSTDTFIFDVTKAAELCVGATVYAFRPAEVLAFLQINVTEPRHYPHVDISRPGIVAQVNYDSRPTALALIDGNHRAARCIMERKIFKAFVLPWLEVEKTVTFEKNGVRS